MAKEVTHAVEFRDPIQPEIGPDKHLLVLACDDGSLYEFQKFEDSPLWNIRARGERGEPRVNWTDSSAKLPGDVEDQLDDITDESWTK